MKKLIFKISILVLSLFLITLPLVSCENAIKGDEAKKTVNDFFELLSSDDYDGVAAIMHPSRSANAENVSTRLNDIESDEMLDFSNGITDIKYTGFESSVYTSERDGGRYELSGTAKCGDVKFEFEIEVVRNSDGYGIYDFEIEV